MKIQIEADRIRLTAENDEDNEAILAIDYLYCASGQCSDDIGNDTGCIIEDEQPYNYCCIPREEECEAIARKSGNLIDESSNN